MEELPHTDIVHSWGKIWTGKKMEPEV